MVVRGPCCPSQSILTEVPSLLTTELIYYAEGRNEAPVERVGNLQTEQVRRTQELSDCSTIAMAKHDVLRDRYRRAHASYGVMHPAVRMLLLRLPHEDSNLDWRLKLAMGLYRWR